MLPQDVWREAFKAAEACDCFLVVGTSAVVYPAAGLIEVAPAAGPASSSSTWSGPAPAGRPTGAVRPSGQTLPELLRRA